MADELIHVEGSVENVVFTNDKNGYCVIDLDADGEMLTVCGDLGVIEEGEILIVEGNYEVHKKYGTQLKAVYCERKLPTTAVNIEKFLASGAIKGIGPGLAKKIVGVFGDETLSYMEHDPDALSRIKGISPQKCKEIQKEARKIFALRNVMSFLNQFEIRSAYAMKAFQKFGGDSMQLISANPYVLCSDGIDLDFRRADAIAHRLSVPKNDEHRILSGIQHILKSNAEAGHTCLPLKVLREKTLPALNITGEDFDKVYESALNEDDLAQYIKKSGVYVFLPDYFRAENYIADRVHILREFAPPEDFNCDAYIKMEEEEGNIQFHELQKKAIATAVSQPVMILTGGPGTGKTTTLNAIISILEKKGENVVLAAPTGRAAKRMSDLTGKNARTIHRLLEMRYNQGGRLDFVHNDNNPLEADAVIIDEMSMVDVLLFESLLRAMRLGTRMILVGDSNQLPSVGAGALLTSLIYSEQIPTVTLTEIFRQAQQSLIVTNAHRIIQGEMPVLSQNSSDFFYMRTPSDADSLKLVTDLVARRLPNHYKCSPTEDIQVIAPSRKGIIGTMDINRSLQKALNPPSPDKAECKTLTGVFRVGDKVMQNRNNYDIVWSKDNEEGAGIFNGDIGTIRSILPARKTAVIDFDGRTAMYSFDIMEQLELAYAITVHKSQGSEFGIVVMPISWDYSRLHYRSLFYTAVTRAKNIIVLVGSDSEIKVMTDHNRHINRFTCLSSMLRRAGNSPIAEMELEQAIQEDFLNQLKDIDDEN